MASTTKATRGAGATLGTKCLADMEYGHNCTAVLRFDRGDEINDAAGVPILKLAVFPRSGPGDYLTIFIRTGTCQLLQGNSGLGEGGCRLLAMNRDYILLTRS
jgi:hypothetical protein